MIPMPEEKIQQSRIKTLWRLNINYSLRSLFLIVKHHKFELPNDKKQRSMRERAVAASGVSAAARFDPCDSTLGFLLGIYYL
jgi:hypothetical protein